QEPGRSAYTIVVGGQQRDPPRTCDATPSSHRARHQRSNQLQMAYAPPPGLDRDASKAAGSTARAWRTVGRDDATGPRVRGNASRRKRKFGNAGRGRRTVGTSLRTGI